MHSMSNWFLLPANTAWYAWGCRCRALPRWYVLGGNLAVSSNAVHGGCRDFLCAGRLHTVPQVCPRRDCCERQPQMYGLLPRDFRAHQRNGRELHAMSAWLRDG